MVTIDNNGVLTVTEGTVGNYRIIATDKLTGISNSLPISINVPMYIRGTVTSTSQTPKLYINMNAVDATLDGTNWKADITSSLPIINLVNLLYNYRRTNNTYVDTIEFPESFNTSNVTSMGAMFYNCKSLTLIGDLSNWNTENVTNMQNMFYDCSSLTSVGDLSNWNTENVTNMSFMFRGCSSLTSIGDLSNWNVGSMINMQAIFYGCNSLTSVGDLSNWNTENVTNISYMFQNCSSLTALNLSNWNTGAVTSMNSAFYGCSSLASVGDLSNWNIGAVTTIESMFSGCKLLTYIGDLSNWNTGAVTSMNSAFYGCSSLASVGDLSNWNTGAVTSMYQTFYGCSSLTSVGDLSNWNTEKVTNMRQIFWNCSKLTSIGLPQIGDETKSVNADSMFSGCSKLANITASGPIYNTVSFSSCPLTLDSAKVVLNALQAPYSGAQTLTFGTSTVNLIKADSETMELVYKKASLGWTINVQAPEYTFRIDAGTVQDNVVASSAFTGQQVTGYESNKSYVINSVSGTTVDFSNRNVSGGLQFNQVADTVNTIYLQNNPALTKFDYSVLNGSVNTFKAYNTGLVRIVETANQSITTNKQIDFYTGQELIAGNYKYVPAEGANLDTAKLTVAFDGQGNYAVVSYTNYTKYEKVINEIMVFDDSINQWIPSTYAAPSDAPEISTMYMSDSNLHTGNQFSKCYFNVAPQTSDVNVDLYINSYGESNYDYTVAFSLDTDWTSTSVPSDTSTGVIANTKGFQYDPSGSIATNYKKVSYTIPGDGQAHRILVIYRKDGSGDTNYDRGFVIAPYEVTWEPVVEN